jgi:peptidoglycan hydrolase-like protein with peptidoglycan-binding domain
MSDPYVYLICTNDRLAEDWLTMNQAGYALRYQLGDDIYFPLMRAEGAVAWTTLKDSCPVNSTMPVRPITVSCIEEQIEASWNRNLRRLAPIAAEEARRDARSLIRLQAALIELQYLTGPADGLYGPATRVAINRFQLDHGIPASGFMTDATSQTLLSSLGGQTAQAAPPAQLRPDAPNQPPLGRAVSPPVMPHETPAMRQVTSDHATRGAVLLLNVAADAPNASLTLSGDPTFTNQKASLCQQLGLAADSLDHEAIGAWLRSHHLNAPIGDIPSCTGLSLRQLDGVFASTDMLGQIDPALFNELANGLENGTVRKFDVLSAAERKIEEDELTVARRTTDEDIANNAQGFGYLAFEGPGQVACIIAEGAGEAWHDILNAHKTELGRDLEYPFEPSIVTTDPDTAYARARRHKCRLIVGNASQLKLVHEAAVRDRLSVTAGVLWVSREAIEATGTALAGRQREAAQAQERARQDAEDQRVLAAERARRMGEVSDAKTRELRTKYGENATALRNMVTERLSALLRQSPTDIRKQDTDTTVSPQDAENARRVGWVVAIFPDFADLSHKRILEGWVFMSMDSSTFEYGRSNWNGRNLETIVIQAKIKEKNADIGRYDERCILLAFQNDAEFLRVRSPHSFDCQAAGQLTLQHWLTSVAFESQWNAPPTGAD